MKSRLITIGILVFLLVTSLSLTVMAETEPVDMEVTQEVIATEEPYYTEAPIETDVYPEPTDYEETYPSDDPYQSESTDSTDTSYSEPLSSVPDTSATEVTDYTAETAAPTEPLETSTYSDYESPDPVYTPADQDFETNPFETIVLDIDAKPSNGKGNFDFIKNNNTKGNDNIGGFLILGIALIFVALAGFTFAILYKRGEGKKKKAVAPASNAPKKGNTPERNRTAKTERRRPEQSQRRSSDSTNRYFDPDDYNDGF